MSDARHTSRGIEVARVTTLAIWAGCGFVSVCTRRLPEPLGREAWLHVMRVLVATGLKLWPDAAPAVREAIETGVDDAYASMRKVA